MNNAHDELLKIAKDMATGQTQSLRLLREMVVDFDLVNVAPNVDTHFFAALYLSKKMTADVWENLATDASFEFDEAQLNQFTVGLGEILLGILSEDLDGRSIISRLGGTTKLLYDYFAKISENPDLVLKGGNNGHS